MVSLPFCGTLIDFFTSYESGKNKVDVFFPFLVDLERFRRVSLAESIDAITVGTFQKKSSDLNSIIISEISKVSTTTLPFSEIKETSEPVAPANESVDVDEYLLKIGEFGKVQKIILLVILVMCIPQSYHSISMYFTGHGPAWRCTGKTSECNMTGTFDVGDAFYEKRCSMNRSSWEFVQEKSYSIVTEVVFFNSKVN